MEATFKIENWPMSNPAAKQALGEIQTTHRIILIPAYDMHGALIWPFHYWKYLENAVVEVCFTLRHWSIAGKSAEVLSDTYSAEIVDMLVLISSPPNHCLTSKT
jgi:hypothetical protein